MGITNRPRGGNTNVRHAAPPPGNSLNKHTRTYLGSSRQQQQTRPRCIDSLVRLSLGILLVIFLVVNDKGLKPKKMHPKRHDDASSSSNSMRRPQRPSNQQQQHKQNHDISNIQSDDTTDSNSFQTVPFNEAVTFDDDVYYLDNGEQQNNEQSNSMDLQLTSTDNADNNDVDDTTTTKDDTTYEQLTTEQKLGMVDDDEFDLTDLHTDTIRTRIAEEIQRLLLNTEFAYNRLWDIYASDGNYFELFEDRTTPQGKAFQWLIQDIQDTNNDKGDNEIVDMDGSNNPTLVQRYVLAVLYFSTLGELPEDEDAMITNPWTQMGSLNFLLNTPQHEHECAWNQHNQGAMYGVKCCTPVVSIVSSTISTLTGGRISAGGAAARVGTASRIAGTNSCKDNAKREVTELFLPELQMRGTLPEEIGFLTSLTVLDLQNNFLDGSLPQSLGLLTDLHYLGLGSNKFTGTVPDTMGSLTKLDTLYLNHNNMDGGDYLKTSICNLKEIEDRHLYRLWADCIRDDDPIQCDCCDVCCDGHLDCAPNVTTRRTSTDESIVDNSGSDDHEVVVDHPPPILQRDKRTKQRKEEREHQAEGWFSKAWSELDR